MDIDSQLNQPEQNTGEFPSRAGSGEPNVPTVAGLEGSYRVIRLLGRGTMSSVYLAEQISMARPVALKILSPSLSNDAAFVERFLREAQAVARLNHPNIVTAIDFGEFDSRFFLAMEFVDGEPLSALIEREKSLLENRVVGIGLQVLSALRHAADHQVIHLDIKPANIMVSKDGLVKLTDFGLAMIVETPGATSTGRKAVGTPYYMAPEQVEGGRLDWRTDQYSLGASLYEAVTGAKPFQGNSVSDILVKRFFEKPEPAWMIGRKKTSRSFSAVLAKMMARSPDGRYQSFSDMEKDFLRVRNGQKPSVAKVAPTASATVPTSSAWDSLGYTSALARINTMRWRSRWTWLLYSSILVIVLLGMYAVVRRTELKGPRPPPGVNLRVLQEADRVEDRGAAVRVQWLDTRRLIMRAEGNPTQTNLRRALFSLKHLAEHPDFKGTAYANVADSLIERLGKRFESVDDRSEEDLHP